MRKSVIVLMALLVVALQIRLWFGVANVFEVLDLHQQLFALGEELDSLKQRNAQIDLDITQLKQDPQMVEEQARFELGMIRRGESYFRVIEAVE